MLEIIRGSIREARPFLGDSTNKKIDDNEDIMVDAG